MAGYSKSLTGFQKRFPDRDACAARLFNQGAGPTVLSIPPAGTGVAKAIGIGFIVPRLAHDPRQMILIVAYCRGGGN